MRSLVLLLLCSASVSAQQMCALPFPQDSPVVRRVVRRVYAPPVQYQQAPPMRYYQSPPQMRSYGGPAYGGGYMGGYRGYGGGSRCGPGGCR